ncbi:hypothetical protein B4U79_17372 [Dinothrombium tinctorium]|uniref:Kielin/chordin-like protein n=1 Tax=Dinothrombium tinctorium TaxID=1965070 RepID=A0A3S3SF75_9ACAR|nr:hypothetical protein B4U79_17372 [Dinothrombium tinctorium]
MLKFTLLFYVIYVCSHDSVLSEYVNILEDCSTCPKTKYLIYYHALNCVPYDKYNCENCVMRFECPKQRHSSEGCSFFGKEYDVGDVLNSPNPCQPCMCGVDLNDSNRKKGKVHCTHVDCPEYFGNFHSKTPNGSNPSNCYLSYSHGQCCATKRVCPTDEELLTLKTCQYKNVTYKIGQEIYPDEDKFNGSNYPLGYTLKTRNPCITCTCQVPPILTCIEKTCPHQSCASVHEEGKCCPVNQCEGDKETNKNSPIVATKKDSCYEEQLYDLYRDLNCTPIVNETAECPKAFKCPENNLTDIELNTVHSTIEARDPCHMHRCAAREITQEPYVTIGGYIECPGITFRLPPIPSDQKARNCYYSYTAGQCCGRRICLTDEAFANATRCRFEGKDYKLGQRIYPSSRSCMRCLCTEDWKDELGIKNPSCKAFKCAPIRGTANRDLKGCAPIFKDRDCCPDDYLCPSTDTRTFNPFDCVFNEKEYEIGSQLIMNDKCVVCNCTTPPLFSCERSTNCRENETTI